MPIDLEEPASPTARVLQAPGFNLCVIATMGFMTAIDVDLFKKGVQQTLIKHPRFSSLLVVKDKKRGTMSWKRTQVDLENHVLVPDLDPGMENPDEFVEDYTSTLASTPMDMTKPLWEIHLLNVKTKDANSIMVFKSHHSLGDGVSLISVVLACSKKISDPESLPVMPSKRPKPVAPNGLVTSLVFLWSIILIVYNTLSGCAWFIATLLYLKDSETPIKGGHGIELSPKRFVHRIINLDDVKFVKNAINVSINDVVLGVTEAGISRHLNTRYKKLRENGSEIIEKTEFLPRNLRLRSAVVFNLRPSATIEDLAEIMEKEEGLNGMWGNLLGIVILPFTIDLQDDPLTYVRRAKATMDRKKRSLESKCAFMVMKLLLRLFGVKIAAAVTKTSFTRTTLTFSNVVGPQEEIILFGHPVCYISPSVHGFPQALTIHYQSYANKLALTLCADEKMIPNPHQLCDDLVKSFENIKEAVIRRELVKDSSQFS